MSPSNPPGPDNDASQAPTPFHLKVYHQLSSFPPLSILTPPSASSSSSIPHTPLSLLPTTTLLDLTHLLCASPSFYVSPSSSPPKIGTRLHFRHVYPASGSYMATDLGSTVLGATLSAAHNEVLGLPMPGAESTKTLASARLIAGDAIFVAVLPPVEGTGEVVPALRAEVGGPGGFPAMGRGRGDLWRGQKRGRGQDGFGRGFGRGDVLVEQDWRRGEEPPGERYGPRGGGNGWNDRGRNERGRGGFGGRERGRGRGGGYERDRW